jgi:hypothetical protein
MSTDVRVAARAPASRSRCTCHPQLSGTFTYNTGGPAKEMKLSGFTMEGGTGARAERPPAHNSRLLTPRAQCRALERLLTWGR